MSDKITTDDANDLADALMVLSERGINSWSAGAFTDSQRDKIIIATAGAVAVLCKQIIVLQESVSK